MAHNARAVFFLDDFAKRQWDDPNYSGTRMSVDQALFMARLEATHASGAAPLVDGYAPFCKHVFMPNFTDATCGALPITEANRHLLRSDYGARSQRELPVLQRWFPAAAVAPLPVAKHLDVILYSREQLVLECQATGRDGSTLPDAPWGVISVKAQDEPFETPMQPITAMRNALGREEGGSGVPLETRFPVTAEHVSDAAALGKEREVLGQLRAMSAAIAFAAHRVGADPRAKTPFAEGARRAGQRFEGGKLDDATVVVALVTNDPLFFS
jgi:hypothetical protein